MTARLLIHGLVHGVGFRNYVKYLARKKGITGWVKNLPEGTVEALLVGEKRVLDEIIRLCWKGPMFAKVKDIRVSWDEHDDATLREFRVIKEKTL